MYIKYSWGMKLTQNLEKKGKSFYLLKQKVFVLLYFFPTLYTVNTMQMMKNVEFVSSCELNWTLKCRINIISLTLNIVTHILYALYQCRWGFRCETQFFNPPLIRAYKLFFAVRSCTLLTQLVYFSCKIGFFLLVLLSAHFFCHSANSTQ